MTAPELSPDDLAQIEAHGLAADEVLRQLALFRNPPPPVRLARPATAGDGVVRLPPERHAGLLARFEEAAAAGRVVKMVPASGAASRMFQSLQAAREADARLDAARVRERAASGDAASRDVVRLVEGLERFAFLFELEGALGRRAADARASGSWGPLLDALLSARGLDMAGRPKGLIPFHRYGAASRTAFEEHLVEGARVARDRTGSCRLHFTVGGEHISAFESLLGARRAALEEALGVRYDVTFSQQSPATDTIAADAEGRPFRSRDGRLVFRPGGHGALIANLGALGGDVVHVKNIDNVAHGRLAGEGVLWKKLLVGLLLEVQADVFSHGRRLREEGASAADLEAALAFLERTFGGRRPPASATRDAVRAQALSRLERPLRVCGVVRNEGEPGGGPFWVRGADGEESLQIVESSQVDRNDPEQASLLRASTHFNPVDLACALRAPDGGSYALGDFVDPATVFLSRKSKDGRELVALERPGLWNGAMAGWLTVFLEIPLSTFTPVKTVLDLLRPEHQEAPGE